MTRSEQSQGGYLRPTRAIHEVFTESERHIQLRQDSSGRFHGPLQAPRTVWLLGDNCRLTRCLRITTMLSTRLVPRLSRPLRALSRSFASESSTPAVANPSAKTPAPQAPNAAARWSTNQRARPVAGENPRFEQTNMDLQPQPLSAMEMVNNEPIRLVDGRKAVCDGGECQSSDNSINFECLLQEEALLDIPKFTSTWCVTHSLFSTCCVLILSIQDKPGPRPCG